MLLLFFYAILSVSAEAEGERSVLENFYIELGGDKWKTNTNWYKTDVDICEWYGITCTENGHVLQISLSDNNLDGIIPDMSGLKYLYAFIGANNNIRGNLEGFNNIKAFMAINIKNNKLSGPLNLVGTTMKWLHCDDNQFTDIFYFVQNNPQVEVIGLGNNKVTTIPRNIGICSELTTLTLGNNAITSQIPSSIGGLKIVSAIDLSNNKITGSIPEELGTLPMVTEILLQNNKLTGSIPNNLFEAPSLTNIDLSNNQLTGSLDALVKSKTCLTAYLQYTKVSGQIPSLMGTSLRHLDLRGTEVSCPISDANREIVVAECPERVTIQADVMSKCPDFGGFANDVAAKVLEKVGEIVDFKVGWIMSESETYSTGYYSMHGNTEVIGNFMFTCALNLYNQSRAFNFYNCMNKNIDYLPLGYDACAKEAGIEVEVLNKCAFGSYGQTLMKEAVDLPKQTGSVWCPSIYLNGEQYCLYNSQPCKAATIDDWIRDICNAYTGKNKPAACAQA